MLLFNPFKNENCFRCGSRLKVTDKKKEITFFQCTKCMRPYAKQKNQTLTDRWLSPLSLVLYEIIFETEKVSQDKIHQVAEDIKRRWPKERLDLLIDDLQSELENPKQKLVHMLNLYGSEEIARDYLRRLLGELT